MKIQQQQQQQPPPGPPQSTLTLQQPPQPTPPQPPQQPPQQLPATQLSISQVHINAQFSAPYLTLCLLSASGFQVGPIFPTFYTPRKLCLWWGILFSRCPCVRPSVTLCFLNVLKSHGWIFIKPCKHVHICKANTLNKKVRVRGQFY